MVKINNPFFSANISTVIGEKNKIENKEYYPPGL